MVRSVFGFLVCEKQRKLGGADVNVGGGVLYVGSRNRGVRFSAALYCVQACVGVEIIAQSVRARIFNLF